MRTPFSGTGTLGASRLDLGPLPSQEHATHIQNIPPDAQLPHVGIQPAYFASLPLLSVSLWSVYFPSYKSYIWLVFKLFSRLTVS